MNTNLAFALEQTIDTTGPFETLAGRTLDPLQLHQLLSAQEGVRPRARTGRRKRMVLKDNHSGLFPTFRVR